MQGGLPPPLDDRARDAVIVEVEVARRLAVRGVEDRVLDDLGQPTPLAFGPVAHPSAGLPLTGVRPVTHEHTGRRARLLGTGGARDRVSRPIEREQAVKLAQVSGFDVEDVGGFIPKRASTTSFAIASCQSCDACA